VVYPLLPLLHRNHEEAYAHYYTITLHSVGRPFPQGLSAKGKVLGDGIMIAGKVITTEDNMRRKYCWEQWFSTQYFTLIRGVDYFCSQSTMYQTIRNNACQRNMKVRIIDTGDSMVVEVTERDYDEVPHTDTVTITG